MAGMIVLGKRIASPRSWSGISPAFSLAQRNLCSSGDGRYVHPNTFVTGNQEGGEPWPPPTQGGFVAETYPGQPPQAPPTQGGFVDHQQAPGGEPYVPVTQGGFVPSAPGNVDYNSYQAPPPGYVPGTGYPHAGYPYVQYPHAAPPPSYPQVQGQYVGENPWVSYHQPGYTYGQEHAGYVYPPQYTPGYPQHVAPPPPPPPPSYVSERGYHQQQVVHQQAPTSAPVQESYQSWSPEQQQQQQQAWAPDPAAAPAEASYAQAVEQAVESEAPEPAEGENPEAQVVYEVSVSEEIRVEEASAQSEAPAESEAVSEPEATPEKASSEEAVSSAAPAEGEDEAEASEDHGEEYDATAAAMAEMGVSSNPQEEPTEDGEEKPEMVEAQAEEEPVKGPQSLLDVETSKAKPAPPPQSESFLDILSKTNLNRQTRPRPQLTLRSNRKTYARLYNLPRQILKSDIVNYFSEINLQKESIHITYDEKFYPIYAQIGFDSTEALRDAHKILQTKGRFGGRIVRWEQFIQFMPPGHPQLSESMKNYHGRMLLMLHLPPEGRLEDVERFFESYGYDPSALSLLEPINMTLARFPKEGNRLVRRAAIGFFSGLEAMRALRERQGDFILNEPVELRLIQ